MIKKRKENNNRRKIMKIFKIITLIITIPLLSSITFASANARDCSNPKGFHAKMMCKLQSATTSNSSESTEKIKSEKCSDSLWGKIKCFGGKKVGEPG